MNRSFDLNKPSRRYKLAKRYREASGIALMPGEKSLAFVQDEKIRIYGVDLQSGKVDATKAFHSGDAEDVVILGCTAYVLAAGAKPAIYVIKDYTDRETQIDRWDLGLNEKNDPEGLCYDATGNRLLIACKGSSLPGDRTRNVYSFDLKTQTPNTNSPVFKIDSDHLGLEDKIFHPSGIAIHPESNDIYLVGSKGVKLLVCCGWDGTVKNQVKLNKRLLEQPEGLAFSESGELFICSEGKKKKAKIYQFSPE
jgi:uncharacterized protein YjiK